MKQREIIVEHKYIDGKYEHCFDDENYNLLELERKVFLNENKELQERIDKAIEYKNQLLFDLNRQYITFEKWEEILEPFENILKGEDKE